MFLSECNCFKQRINVIVFKIYFEANRNEVSCYVWWGNRRLLEMRICVDCLIWQNWLYGHPWSLHTFLDPKGESHWRRGGYTSSVIKEWFWWVCSDRLIHRTSDWIIIENFVLQTVWIIGQCGLSPLQQFSCLAFYYG